MTFTYSSTAGLTTSLARVRSLCDNSNSATVYLTDEEINEILGRLPNIYLAAAEVCEIKASRWADYVSTSNVGGLSVSAGDRYTHWMEMAERLRRKAATSSVAKIVPLVGGAKVSENDTYDQDSDLVAPEFRRGDDRENTDAIANNGFDYVVRNRT